MGLISRVSAFINGTPNDGTAVDAEFENFRTTINGNIDNANINPSAAIAATKVDPIPPARVLDHADTEAEYKTFTTPGDTGTPSLPSTLEGELERLRYRIGANKGYLNGSYYETSGTPGFATLSWTEPAIVGHNLLPNPGFEVQSGATNSAPDGWTLVGTPSTVAIAVPAHPGTGLEKRSLNIVTDAINEGIEVAIGGLKTNVKYLVGMSYTIVDNGTTPGTIRLTTTGGLATGDYQNLVLTDFVENINVVSTFQGLVRPTSTPGAITVRLDATQAGANFNIHEVWMYEVADGKPVDLPSIPTQTAVYSTADDTVNNTGGGAWSNRSALSLSQYIPFRGYRLRYEVTACFKSTTSGGALINTEYGFRIQQNIDGGGATTVEGPVAWRTAYTGNNEFSGGMVTMSYVVDNPNPGSTYAFTFDAYSEGSSNGADTLIFNPTVATGLATQSRARLIVERI